jgi:hypothetical protein
MVKMVKASLLSQVCRLCLSEVQRFKGLSGVLFWDVEVWHLLSAGCLQIPAHNTKGRRVEMGRRVHMITRSEVCRIEAHKRDVSKD